MAEETIEKVKAELQAAKSKIWYYEAVLVFLRRHLTETGDLKAAHIAHRLDEDSQRRGHDEVMALALATLDTLELPKNAEKGGWDGAQWDDLYSLLQHETCVELKADMWKAAQGERDGLEGVLRETTDCAAFLAMIRDKACKELEALG